ncbi:MAG: GTP-dependent dephospho-CoA kinase family protein [Candidatus Bathyarchaeia archaeon]
MEGLRPDDRLRAILKEPLGTLLRGAGGSEYTEVAKLIERDGIGFLISVGDVVSKDLVEKGMRVNVRIVDGRIMRGDADVVHRAHRRTFRARNPPGMIGFPAWGAVREAVSCGGGLVIIDGEEDLLALPAILEAPEGALVVYGQPGEGIVVVKVDKTSKERARSLIGMMERVEEG